MAAAPASTAAAIATGDGGNARGAADLTGVANGSQLVPPAVGTYGASGFFEKEGGVEFLQRCGYEVRWEDTKGDTDNVCILRPGYDSGGYGVPKAKAAVGQTHLTIDQSAVGGVDWGVGFRSYNVDQANTKEGLNGTRGALDVVAAFFDECMLDVNKGEFGSCLDVNPITPRGDGAEWRGASAGGGRSSRRPRGNGADAAAAGSPPKKTKAGSSSPASDGGKSGDKGGKGKGVGAPAAKRARHDA